MKLSQFKELNTMNKLFFTAIAIAYTASLIIICCIVVANTCME